MTNKRTMAVKDEEVPKLDSLPPDGEPEEVTRVGRPDEIRRALEVEGKDASHVQPKQAPNNIATPPAPPPSAGTKKAVAEASAGVRLAPPPADIVLADREQGNDTPTKPPLAGVGDNVDVDAAFRENPFEDPDIPKSSEHLDSSLLEPAPPSMKALAPPLPAAATRSAPPPPPVAKPSSDPPADVRSAPSARPASTPSAAPLASRESAAPAASRSMLLVLVVVLAVVGAFFIAAIASGK